MVDKDTILQVICGLMKHPQYLSETDRYNLSIADFSSTFEKYVFSAIFNLYKNGAQIITPVDIDNYFNTHKTAKVVFEKSNGIEYLQDALEFSQEENFPFYYSRLKKFNALQSLREQGFPIDHLYVEDLTRNDAKEINDKFEAMDIRDIFDSVKKKFMKIESDYSTGDASETAEANKNIQKLIDSLKIRPEVGAPLQGRIFNTICRGARRTKFYIRSFASGVGKTRYAVGDACMLAYPIRFNTQNWEWEWNGSCEKTLFIATEQELEEIQTLILAYLSGINEEKILYGSYNEEEEKVIQQAVRVMEFYKDNLFIVRLSNPNIEQIKAIVRQNWIVNNIKNVFYDYIFSSPSLLNEFRDLRIREDVVLNMLSTALKDLAVEMGLFVMTATQTNAKSEEEGGIKNESAIRGARSIIDKCDIACIGSRVTSEELELLSGITEQIGIVPNHVIDVYKVRRGRYVNVKIWISADLGTCRRTDLFVTDEKYRSIENFQAIEFMFTEEDNGVIEVLKELNSDVQVRPTVKFNDVTNNAAAQKSVLDNEVGGAQIDVDNYIDNYVDDDVDEIVDKLEKKGLFGNLL